MFLREQNRSLAIYKQALSEYSDQLLLDGLDLVSLNATLSADGKWLLFLAKNHSNNDGEVGLWRSSERGGPPQEVLEGRLTNIDCPHTAGSLCVMSEASPDGKQLIFSNVDAVQGRGHELARMSVYPADASALANWRISPNGRMVAFYTGEKSVRLFSLKGDSTQEIEVEYSGGVNDVTWDSQSQDFYSFNPSALGWALLRTGLSGKSTVVHEFRESLAGSGIVSRQGNRIAVRVWNRRSNVWMMDGF